jgi:hypothetical protein
MPSAHRQRHHAAPSTAVSLRRWLCVWLALLTLTQMIGSMLAGLQGSWHHHRPSVQAGAPSVPVIRWRHSEVVHADAHTQMHASGEAHEHAATDPSVFPLGPDTATEAVAQLASAVAPSADLRWSPHDRARHVQAGAASWAPTTHSIAPPLQPPRG